MAKPLDYHIMLDSQKLSTPFPIECYHKVTEIILSITAKGLELRHPKHK